MNKSEPLLAPVGPGELLDKLSILEIKLEKISDPNKLENIKTEYKQLESIKAKYIPLSKKITHLYQQLKSINQELWKIEDDIRDCEKIKDFSETFIQLARSVYITNDKRATTKKEINQLLKANIIEEKSYTNY
tara:strand:+ start:888 stop:1286 length:399 start_codon:yes stop_codon:yes gene_type:complete